MTWVYDARVGDLSHTPIKQKTSFLCNLIIVSLNKFKVKTETKVLDKHLKKDKRR